MLPLGPAGGHAPQIPATVSLLQAGGCHAPWLPAGWLPPAPAPPAPLHHPAVPSAGRPARAALLPACHAAIQQGAPPHQPQPALLGRPPCQPQQAVLPRPLPGRQPPAPRQGPRTVVQQVPAEPGRLVQSRQTSSGPHQAPRQGALLVHQRGQQPCCLRAARCWRPHPGAAAQGAPALPHRQRELHCRPHAEPASGWLQQVLQQEARALLPGRGVQEPVQPLELPLRLGAWQGHAAACLGSCLPYQRLHAGLGPELPPVGLQRPLQHGHQVQPPGQLGVLRGQLAQAQLQGGA